MEHPNLKRPFLIGLLIAAIFLISWEFFWRSYPDYYHAAVEDDRFQWSEHRAKVEQAGPDDVVIIGSSRTGFNIKTYIWEEVQGVKPINLSTDGKPPAPFLKDIVENTDFQGTLIVGMTPLLFFSTESDGFWINANQWVQHYHKETYAQKLGQWLAKPLQRNLVMLSASELDFYNDLDLRTLIERLPLNKRVNSNFHLPNFSYPDEDRNLNMFESMRWDTVFSNEVKATWLTFLPYIPPYNVIKGDLQQASAEILENVRAFKKKGGKIIFVRHKAEPEWGDYTKLCTPRDSVYEPFIQASGYPAYHFEDYPFMSKHTLLDWSHMDVPSSEEYTRDLVNQMLQDGHLVKPD